MGKEVKKKISLFADNMIIYLENPWESIFKIIKIEIYLIFYYINI